MVCISQVAGELHDILGNEIRHKHDKYAKMSMDEYELLEHLKVRILKLQKVK